MFRSLRQWGSAALLSAASVIAVSSTGQAAETIYLDLGLFSRSIPVTSLSDFAKTGEADGPLNFVLKRMPPADQQALRLALNAPHDLQAAELSHWLYTPLGEQALASIGEAVQTTSRLNGHRAIRAGLILAASDPEGLTVLNFFKHFPTEGIRLDAGRLLADFSNLQESIAETQTIVDAIQQAAPTSGPIPSRATLNQPGMRQVVVQTLTLNDAGRKRTYPVDIYRPDRAQGPAAVPVVVLSHGLGSSRRYLVDLARHMASHGVAVAVPDHIRSNSDHKQAVQDGLASEILPPSEFVDRPLDISFLLDELQRRNASDFQGQLKLDRVAVAGHSLGGYTTLALAGAAVDLTHLEETCTSRQTFLIDVTRLISCRIFSLPPEQIQQLAEGDLRDERVGLAMMYAPISHLFGEAGIGHVQIPTVLMGGSLDVVTPFMSEQVKAFSWLTSDKYLYLSDNTSHDRSSSEGMYFLLNPDGADDPSVEASAKVLIGLFKSLMVAFPKVYLSDDDQWRAYLTSEYPASASQEPFRLHMVRSLSLPDD